ncbi:unnamed protein product, partial [Meganyctiphanes norvegica]
MDQTRYKQRSAKFSSAKDARAVRALANRVDRKAQRDRGILGRRNFNISDVLDDSDLSFQSHAVPETKPQPTKTYEEMQEELYQQLLVYKNDKKKKLEKEKHCRRPVFKTGGFTPEQPKFLISDDIENFAANKSENTKITPFKFMRSTTRSGDSSTSKVLKFRSGATPNMTSKGIKDTAPYKSPGVAKKRILTERGSANISASNTPKETVRKLGGIRSSWKQISNKSRAHSRMNAVTKEQMRLKAAEEELGVAALPSSPANSVTVSKPTVNTSNLFSSNCRKSFAPDDFKFGFKGLVAQIMAKAKGIMEETEDKTEKGMLIKEITKEDDESEKNENITEVNCTNETFPKEETKANHMNYTLMSNNRFNVMKENETSSKTISDKLISKIAESKSDEHYGKPNISNDMKLGESDENDVYIKEKVGPASVDVTDISKYENIENEVEYENDEVFKSHSVTNVCEDSVEMMDIDENSEIVNTPNQNHNFKHFSAHKSRRSSISSCKGSLSCTPSRRRSTHAKSCCNTGSPMSRLRPRTPCSRSTRRSIAAHTDHPQNLSFTPGRRSSTRRSIRRSLVASLKNEERAAASPIKLYSSPILTESKKTPVEDKEPCLDNTSMIKLSTTIDASVSQQQVSLNDTTHKQSSSQSKDTPINNDNKTATTEFATPLGDITGSVSHRKRGSRVSWMVECSPYITTSRGSSKKERRSVSRLNEDLTGLFDDIPTDGSPLPDYLIKSAIINATHDSSALPAADIEPVFDGKICTNLLSLLQPT